MFERLPPPTVFAHRGASNYAPENTLAAFELAVRQGAPAIELDAKLSSDRQVVVIHDQSVDRTTQGKGRVRDLSLEQLKQLDAGSFYDSGFAGERIPSLDEVFTSVGKRIFINVELTNYATPLDALPQKVAALVRRHNLEEAVMFSSFNPLALMRIRRLLPECPIGLLALPGKAGAWARSGIGRLVGYQALHPEASDVTPQLVESAHRRGKRVYVWTVNQEAQMKQLFGYGVDGIFTDDPPLALQALAARRT